MYDKSGPDLFIFKNLRNLKLERRILYKFNRTNVASTSNEYIVFFRVYVNTLNRENKIYSESDKLLFKLHFFNIYYIRQYNL